ncbi:MAG: hypothetical protein GXO75_00415 [Calditrichaeota bacterium]|nr:hypothetical protein [Calditrichota bacterium]
MKDTIIFVGLISALSTLFVVIVFIYGLVILITGRFRSVVGKHARIAGLFLIVQLPLCFLIYAPFYESLKWGRQANVVQGGIGHIIIFLIFAVAGLIAGFSYINKRKNTN